MRTIALTGAFVLAAVVLPVEASASVKAPTCSTVRASLVYSVLGRSPGPVKTTKYSSGGLGYVNCVYGVYDLVTYIVAPNRATMRSTFLSTEAAVADAKVAGIGGGAFIQRIFTTATINGRTTNNLVRLLRVLDGRVMYSVGGAFASVAQEETLAKKMLALV